MNLHRVLPGKNTGLDKHRGALCISHVEWLQTRGVCVGGGSDSALNYHFALIPLVM